MERCILILFVSLFVMQIEIPLDFSDAPKRKPPSRFAAYMKKEPEKNEVEAPKTIAKPNENKTSKPILIFCKRKMNQITKFALLQILFVVIIIPHLQKKLVSKMYLSCCYFQI